MFIIIVTRCCSVAHAAQEPSSEQLTLDVDRNTALLQKDPDNPHYLNALGFAYYKLDRLPAAIDALNRCIKTDPRHAVAHNNLGATHLRLKEYEKAEALFRKALELEPRYVKAAYNLAVSLFRQKRYKDAYQAYKAAGRIDRDYVHDRFEGSTAREQIKDEMRKDPDNEAWKGLSEEQPR
ncbi:MAG: tetratricopeptide repeat protein [Nitrospirota bacterium]|nr:tetratricopeptide repeat protein [Nitrospirota bacterium]